MNAASYETVSESGWSHDAHRSPIAEVAAESSRLRARASWVSLPIAGLRRLRKNAASFVSLANFDQGAW